MSVAFSLPFLFSFAILLTHGRLYTKHTRLHLSSFLDFIRYFQSSFPGVQRQQHKIRKLCQKKFLINFFQRFFIIISGPTIWLDFSYVHCVFRLFCFSFLSSFPGVTILFRICEAMSGCYHCFLYISPNDSL